MIGGFVDQWVRRSAKSKSKAVIDEVEVEGSLSLSLSLSGRESGNGLK